MKSFKEKRSDKRSEGRASQDHKADSLFTKSSQRSAIKLKSLTPEMTLQLQRSIGNQATGRILTSINTASAAESPIQRQVIVRGDPLSSAESFLLWEQLEAREQSILRHMVTNGTHNFADEFELTMELEKLAKTYDKIIEQIDKYTTQLREVPYGHWKQQSLIRMNKFINGKVPWIPTILKSYRPVVNALNSLQQAIGDWRGQHHIGKQVYKRDKDDAVYGSDLLIREQIRGADGLNQTISELGQQNQGFLFGYNFQVEKHFDEMHNFTLMDIEPTYDGVHRADATLMTGETQETQSQFFPSQQEKERESYFVDYKAGYKEENERNLKLLDQLNNYAKQDKKIVYWWYGEIPGWFVERARVKIKEIRSKDKDAFPQGVYIQSERNGEYVELASKTSFEDVHESEESINIPASQEVHWDKGRSSYDEDKSSQYTRLDADIREEEGSRTQTIMTTVENKDDTGPMIDVNENEEELVSLANRIEDHIFEEYLIPIATQDPDYIHFQHADKYGYSTRKWIEFAFSFMEAKGIESSASKTTVENEETSSPLVNVNENEEELVEKAKKIDQHIHDKYVFLYDAQDPDYIPYHLAEKYYNSTEEWIKFALQFIKDRGIEPYEE